ncbi:MAG: 4Fe-4S binding protein [Euryarchaeota archaeon]|nr:4Fe-4S binding protein [Euryarchaeota archaeon]
MRLRTYRRTAQVAFVALTVTGLFGVATTGIVYPYFFCYACPFDVGTCPLGILEHATVDMRLIGLMEGTMLLLYLFGFLALMGVLFGRAFCGWACPVGFVQDVFGKTKAHRKIAGEIAPNGVSPRLKYVKYVVLIFIPILSVAFLDLVYTRFCPVGGITGTLPALLFFPDDWAPSTWFAVKVVSMALFFALIIAVGRGWCKYLCPLGAFLSPWNKVSGTGITRKDEKCSDCGLCERHCPMNIKDIGVRPELECIQCGRCVEECRSKSLKFGPRFRLSDLRSVGVWATATVIAASLLVVGLVGGGYGRTDEINAIPCLGCLALDPKGDSSFRFLGDVPQPDFITASLSCGPLLLHYRTDVCSACDEMEPTIKELEANNGTGIKFVHINLDHATDEQDRSYDIYDVKGSPDTRTGVPMLVLLTISKEDGVAKPYFATFYGIQPRDKLAGAIELSKSLYAQAGASAAPSSSKFLVELFVDQQCTYCLYSEDALVELSNKGNVRFMTYVTDAPGESGAFAKWREASYQASLSAGGAHPWAVFSGGLDDQLGGTTTVKNTYSSIINGSNFQPLNISVSGTISDAGSAARLELSIGSAESSSAPVLLEAAMVERTSRWDNVRDEPIPSAFLGMAMNESISVPAGGWYNRTASWSGTDALPYSSMRLGNLAVVVTAWQGDRIVYSDVILSPASDGIEIASKVEPTPVLPNGTASIQLTLRNFKNAAVDVALNPTPVANWSSSVSARAISIPANGTATVTFDFAGTNTSAGDSATFEVAARGVGDPTLYATASPRAVVRNDVLPPIVTQPSSPQTARADEGVRIGVVVGDNTAVRSVKLSYFSCNDNQCSATYTVNMTLEGNEYIANVTPLGLDHNIMHYKITADDYEDNANVTDWYDVELEPVLVETEEAPITTYVIIAMFSAAIVVAAGVILANRRR